MSSKFSKYMLPTRVAVVLKDLIVLKSYLTGIRKWFGNYPHIKANWYYNQCLSNTLNWFLTNI